MAAPMKYILEYPKVWCLYVSKLTTGPFRLEVNSIFRSAGLSKAQVKIRCVHVRISYVPQNKSLLLN